MVKNSRSRRAKGKAVARSNSPPRTPTQAKFPHRRTTNKKANAVASEFDIPYFGHMQLNPAKYPEDVGLPTSGLPFPEVPYGSKRAKGGSDAADSSNDSDEEDAMNPGSYFTSQNHQSSGKELIVAAHKRLKVDGGRPALPKKVTADLDSDDQLIVRMKHARFQEVEIAQRLKDEGRVNYHPKTIGTRWARLKRALAAHQDEQMDQDLTDWHDGDDNVLAKAIAHADALVAKMKADADEKKWQLVADRLKYLKPVVNFSRNACKNRFDALNDGTAKPTPESIENPDDHIRSRVQSRIDKQKAIDHERQFSFHDNNIRQNGWTSKMDKHDSRF